MGDSSTPTMSMMKMFRPLKSSLFSLPRNHFSDSSVRVTVTSVFKSNCESKQRTFTIQSTNLLSVCNPGLKLPELPTGRKYSRIFRIARSCVHFHRRLSSSPVPHSAKKGNFFLQRRLWALGELASSLDRATLNEPGAGGR